MGNCERQRLKAIALNRRAKSSDTPEEMGQLVYQYAITKMTHHET